MGNNGKKKSESLHKLLNVVLLLVTIIGLMGTVFNTVFLQEFEIISLDEE